MRYRTDSLSPLFLAGSFLLAFLLWGTPLLYPVRLFVVFLHECGHALAAVLTGGKVLAIRIDPNESGWTQFQGGIPLITLCAGYLGSTLFGSLLLRISARPALARYGLAGLGGGMLLVALFLGNGLFTVVYTILFALLLLFVAFKTTWDLLLLRFLGVTSSLFALLDIQSDLLHWRIHPASDAARLSEMLLGTNRLAPFFGLLWAGISIWWIYRTIQAIQPRSAPPLGE
ncbi:MAG: M50 family peptidase [Deltaproteobacteria bacterium]|nr:MAG: M50 family peptidase [Deltaproteobacteria bacterium]